MKAFVEYNLKPDQAGYTAGDFSGSWFGRQLPFRPKPEHDNRRVEEFHSEQDAERFIKSFSNPVLFVLATDLMDAAQRELIEKAAQTAVVKGIAALQIEVAQLRADIQALKAGKHK